MAEALVQKETCMHWIKEQERAIEETFAKVLKIRIVFVNEFAPCGECLRCMYAKGR